MAPTYSDRCVAVLDLLGIETAAIEHGSDATPLSAIDKLFEAMRPDLDHKKSFLRMSRLSNRICLSAAGTNESFLTICLQVSGISSSFLKIGYPVRGGIAMGAVYHEQDSIFGPALIRATELATVTAKYPRVVFDPAMPISDSTFDAIPKDDDGLRYLDVLSFGFVNDYWAGHPSYRHAQKLPSADLASDTQQISQMARRRAASASDAATKVHYEWLQRFADRPRRKDSASAGFRD